MCLSKKIIISFVTTLMAFTFPLQVFAGNKNSTPSSINLDTEKNYYIYLIGGPTTSKDGLENLKRILKLEFQNQGLQTNTQTIFPHPNQECAYHLEYFLKNKETTARTILDRMQFSHRAGLRVIEATASTNAIPANSNDVEPIIIAHGWGAIGAIRAAELLPTTYHCRIKNLILIGAPKFPISCNEIKSRAHYIYHAMDPMNNIGNWFLDGTGIKHSPAKHIAINLHYPEEASSSVVSVSSSQVRRVTNNLGGSAIERTDFHATTVQDTSGRNLLVKTRSKATNFDLHGLSYSNHSVNQTATIIEEADLNNCYFYRNQTFTDRNGVNNLQKTINSFYDDLYLEQQNSARLKVATQNSSSKDRSFNSEFALGAAVVIGSAVLGTIAANRMSRNK